MINYFNARFDVIDAGYHDINQYRIVGNVVDNTGTYFAANAQIGDIIYVDGTMLGYSLFRYKIIEINWEETIGAQLSVITEWDTLEIEPQEPFGGMEGIIGALSSNKITANVTPQSYNSANEILIANVNSYQNMLLGLSSGSADIITIKEDIEDITEIIETTKLEWE